jgi:hypothetical protein
MAATLHKSAQVFVVVIQHWMTVEFVMVATLIKTVQVFVMVMPW